MAKKNAINNAKQLQKEDEKAICGSMWLPLTPVRHSCMSLSSTTTCLFGARAGGSGRQGRCNRQEGPRGGVGARRHGTLAVEHS